MTNQQKAYVFGLAAVFCWSTVATAFKLSLAQMTPAQLLLGASITSVALLLGILLYQGKLTELSKLKYQDYLSSLLFGFLNPFVYYLILLQAYKLLPAQEAQSINYTWALTMSLLAVPLLKHRLHWQDILAAIPVLLRSTGYLHSGQPLITGVQ